MPGQHTCRPVIVTLPARLDAAAAEQAAGQITAAFTPWGERGGRRPDRRRVRRPLRYPEPAQGPPRGHRPVRACAVRDPPGGPVDQTTGFAGTHPLLAVYPTLLHALAGRSPLPPGKLPAAPAARISPAPSASARGPHLRR